MALRGRQVSVTFSGSADTPVAWAAPVRWKLPAARGRPAAASVVRPAVVSIDPGSGQGGGY